MSPSLCDQNYIYIIPSARFQSAADLFFECFEQKRGADGGFLTRATTLLSQINLHTEGVVVVVYWGLGARRRRGQ